MPFYIRKSKAFGPVRINLSKSGIGGSVGVKGARVGVGPKGPYAAGGRKGIYYRKNLGGKPTAVRPLKWTATPRPVQPHKASGRLRRVYWISLALLPCAGLAFLYGAVEFPSASARLALAVAVFIVAVLGWCIVRHGIREQPEPPVAEIVKEESQDMPGAQGGSLPDYRYELSEAQKQSFAKVQNALSLLCQARGIDRVTGTHTNTTPSRGSAASLVDLEKVTVAPAASPGFTTNVRVFSIDLGKSRLFFLPDCILVGQGGALRKLPYSDVSVEYSTQRFVESAAPPADAEVVGTTYAFVNPDGTRDMTQAVNPLRTVVLYGRLRLRSSSGLDVILQISSRKIAEQFLLLWRQAGRNGAAHNDAATPISQQATDAYRLLGLIPGATPAEITAAYHRMAQQYHPDKVAALGPELRQLAEAKMKQVNAAFALLMKQPNPAPGPRPSPSPPPKPSPPPPPSPPPQNSPFGSRLIGQTVKLTGPDGTALAFCLRELRGNVASASPRAIPQGRWVVADWDVTNEGPTAVALRTSAFCLQTADGFVISPSSVGGLPTPQFRSVKLGPSQRNRGFLYYDVPSGSVIKTGLFQPQGQPQHVIANIPV